MHTMGVCHRDMKPDNVIISDKIKKLRIIDFNVSRMFEKGSSMREATGLEEFMAPEMLAG